MMDIAKLKLGDLFLLENVSMRRMEIVKIRSLNENYVTVSHVGEEGDWVVDFSKSNYKFIDNDSLLKQYKKNMVDSKIVKLKLKALLNESVDNKNEQLNNAITLCEYEPNFIDCDCYRFLNDVA